MSHSLSALEQENGRSALTYAAENGRFHTARVLLAAGADVVSAMNHVAQVSAAETLMWRLKTTSLPDAPPA
jgi:ankyrin repeat protein